MHSQVDVCFNPTLFPGSGAFIVKRNAIHSRLAAGAQEQAPRIGVVVFPALCDGLVVAAQL